MTVPPQGPTAARERARYLSPLSGEVQVTTPLLGPPLLPLGPTASGTVETLEAVHANAKLWWRGGGPYKASSVTVIHCDVSCGEPEGSAGALALSAGLIDGSSWEGEATEGAFRATTSTKSRAPSPQGAYPPQKVCHLSTGVNLPPDGPRRNTKNQTLHSTQCLPNNLQISCKLLNIRDALRLPSRGLSGWGQSLCLRLFWSCRREGVQTLPGEGLPPYQPDHLAPPAV